MIIVVKIITGVALVGFTKTSIFHLENINIGPKKINYDGELANIIN